MASCSFWINLGFKDHSFCIARDGIVIRQKDAVISPGRGGWGASQPSVSPRGDVVLLVVDPCDRCTACHQKQPRRTETTSPACFSTTRLTLFIFSPRSPFALLSSLFPTGIRGAVTWLCSGTCVVCVAAAGTRWAPAGSLWTASGASPPAHAPPLQHV